MVSKNANSIGFKLQVLHSLLETGHAEDKEVDENAHCSFLGLSNWALDPAKMNRGIFLNVSTPGEESLNKIAW